MGSVTETKRPVWKPRGRRQPPRVAVRQAVEQPLAFDTETTGLDLRHGDTMFAWATCDEGARSEVHRISSPAASRVELGRLWESGRSLVCHNVKFDATASEQFLQRPLRNGNGYPPIHDTHKLSHILQNHHQDHSLDHLAWELAGYPRVDARVKQMAAQLGGFHKIPPHIMEKYQRLDVERTMCLFLFFWPKVQENPAWLDCYNTEIALIWSTMRLEARGLMLHRPRTRGMITEMAVKAEGAREEVFRIIGRRFNPASDPQLRKVLYKDLGFPILRRTAKAKAPALDKGTLLELQAKTNHPIFDALLRARSYEKGVTVLEGYLTLAGESAILHPTINTCVAITGRESSENPNLQNVQKSAPGEATHPYPVRARHAFRPRPGYINVHKDYSGIEMRLLVHYAQEPEMLRCMNEGDGDVHALGAETYYERAYTELPPGPEKKGLRDRAKQGGFAQGYGASPTKLGATLGLPAHLGVAAYHRYRARFPKLAGLAREIIALVREQGYVESVFGRRYHVPAGEAYVGVNYLIQGTACEILKRAQNRLDEYNRRETGDAVKILLPIHDEVISEYPRAMLGELGGYLRAVRRLMIDFPQLSVPLDVEASLVTSSWEKKVPYRIPA